VTINPPEAVAAGAQWTPSGAAAWEDSGTIASNLFGIQAISFLNIPGWKAPAGFVGDDLGRHVDGDERDLYFDGQREADGDRYISQGEPEPEQLGPAGTRHGERQHGGGGRVGAVERWRVDAGDVRDDQIGTLISRAWWPAQIL